ncbi:MULTISPECIES: hypothetical protein [unclassified Leifsonia]|uniref:hypothetical protein n=1 Tax=unclassified Leifsonia TaxID=2663824 RepID=UPI0006F225D6|nr:MULTISPECIES: hypothetical protein [unclassified Leifsonia]KQX07790.1 hypothetical protein ASC59_08685 [Leifsonia sp. Root1293]KRA12072.1 hypothetical protein ASD61_08685 [Leifsonia sp. Root60]
MSCADLIDAADVAAVVGDGAVAEPEQAAFGIGAPRLAAVVDAGGWRCVLANQTGLGAGNFYPEDYRGMIVQILPDGATDPRADWAQMLEYYGTDESGFESEVIPEPLIGRCFEGGCELDFIIGSYWVEISARAPAGGTPEGAADRFLLLAERIAGLLTSPAASAEPTPTSAQEAPSCEALVDPVAARDAAELPTDIDVNSPHGGWSLAAGSWNMAPLAACMVIQTGTEHSYGAVEFMPGGAWALPMIEAAHPDGVVESIEGTDRAVFSCVDGQHGGCRIDAAVDGAWLQVQLFDEVVPDRADAARRLAALAAVVVGNLTA